MRFNLEEMRHFLHEQVPFHKLVPFELEAVEPGFALVKLTFFEELIGNPWRPSIHGGVIATLMDVAAGAAVFSVMEPEDLLSTIDMRVDYLLPGTRSTLYCEARVLKSGKQVVTVNTRVHQGDPDQPIADGRVVYNVRRKVG